MIYWNDFINVTSLGQLKWIQIKSLLTLMTFFALRSTTFLITIY